jgi:hypothetical protein
VTYKILGDGTFAPRTFTSAEVLEMIKQQGVRFVDL